jgi:magnesium chelatase subunit D
VNGSAWKAPAGWPLAVLAARLFAVDPAGTGICVRASAGPQRERWLELLGRIMQGAPIRKIPPSIADDRLLGGLDLAATLAAGRPVAERGVLAETHGGALLLLSAERISPSLAARIASVHDAGEVRLERDGLTQCSPARFGLILLDEGAQDDECSPASLADRIAFRIDLSAIVLSETAQAPALANGIQDARRRLPDIAASDAAIEALCAASLALGIGSVRAPMLALRAASISAALAGRSEVGEADLALAGQLVLAWRAQNLPQTEAETDEPEDAPDEAPPPDSDPQSDPATGDTLSDVVLDAAKAALPADLLERLAAEGMRRERAGASGQSGAQRKSAIRGRRIGILPGQPRGGRRLDLVATLRAAAPWQRIRRDAILSSPARIQIRGEDFRIKRFAERRETLTIFAVDASGSQALNRMAEAKGAVELLLADCYIRRDQVALIAFRGSGSDMLLPPTRSLVRAKRALSGLPAGGGTPLARGIDAAATLAHAAARRGQTPMIVLLTDGRANLTRDGQSNRALAQDDARASALAFRRAGWRALLIDTSPQPEPRAAGLAAAMGAVYLALPYLDARLLSSAVQGAQAGASRHG